MSRFGNPLPPAEADAPDVLHGWALVDGVSLAMQTFAALEHVLEDLAQQRYAVTVGAPAYETFRLSDPGVPAPVREWGCGVATTPDSWWVHGWVRFEDRMAGLPTCAVEVLAPGPAVAS